MAQGRFGPTVGYFDDEVSQFALRLFMEYLSAKWYTRGAVPPTIALAM